jgi:hypothetical protein
MLLDFHEKESAIEKQCRDPFMMAATAEKLRNSIEPFTAEIVVRERPDDSAEALGTIRAKIEHRKVSLEFHAAGTAEPIPFTPDLFLDGRTGFDYEGHPWCHQTVMCRQGDWVQVPPQPWPKPGWISIKAFGLVVRSLSQRNSFGAGVPYELDGNPIDLLGRTDSGLCVRPAGVDSFCNYLDDFLEFKNKGFFDGDTLVAMSEIPWKDLRDGEGRLRLKLATKPALKSQTKEVPHPNIGWIGLFDPSWDEWLSHTYSSEVERTCDAIRDPVEHWKCVEAVTARNDMKKQVEMPVHEAPDPSSPRVGVITTRVEGNLFAEFRAEGSSDTVEFWPDEVDRDWGYGLHFHQTYLDKQGTWYKLPANPLPRPGWINMALVTDKPDDRSQILGAYGGLTRDVVVLGLAADGSGLCARDENDWDGCPSEFEEEGGGLDKVRVIPWKDLLDKDGHLLLHNNHTRGC